MYITVIVIVLAVVVDMVVFVVALRVRGVFVISIAF